MSEAAQVGLPGVEAQRGDVGSDACFTPLDIIEGVTLALGGHIGTDPCWHPDSHVPDERIRYDGRDRGDGLILPYEGPLWINPPYSDPLPWARRFANHAEAENRCIALVKCDPSTEWWGVMTGLRASVVIGLVNSRIRFDGSFAGGGTPSFASAFVAAGVNRYRLQRLLPIATWMQVEAA